MVRLDKSILNQASSKLEGNLFMHIAMNLDMLATASRVDVADQPVVKSYLPCDRFKDNYKPILFLSIV